MHENLNSRAKSPEVVTITYKPSYNIPGTANAVPEHTFNN